MARQEVSRTTHIEEGELRVTHENAILTNITQRQPHLLGATRLTITKYKLNPRQGQQRVNKTLWIIKI